MPEITWPTDPSQGQTFRSNSPCGAKCGAKSCAVPGGRMTYFVVGSTEIQELTTTPEHRKKTTFYTRKRDGSPRELDNPRKGKQEANR